MDFVQCKGCGGPVLERLSHHTSDGYKCQSQKRNLGEFICPLCPSNSLGRQALQSHIPERHRAQLEKRGLQMNDILRQLSGF